VRRGLITIVAAVLAALSPAVAQASTGPIVRFSTSVGNIDVQLLPNDAPKTVANFLSYVNSGAYANTFFHRAVPAANGLSVIQGGGDQLVGGQISAIKAGNPIGNEYKDSNVRGTLAMALSANNPNSATSEWFFNVADNSAALNPQLFTVFGKVLDAPSLSVMDAIFAEPEDTASFPGCSDCSDPPLRNWSSGQTATSANLITTSITVLNDTTPPKISIESPTNGSVFTLDQGVGADISCDDGTGTGVASCAATAGADSKTGELDTHTLGWHTFTVTATDYAGNTSTKSVRYQIVRVPGLNKYRPLPSPAPKLTSALTGSATGAVRFALECAGPRRCNGRATVYYIAAQTHKKVNIGALSYSIAVGGHRTLTMRITQSNRTTLTQTQPPVFLQLAPNWGKLRTSRVQLRFTAGT
jgi:peptidyl-prolyl cis-trans isomerase A (cyclophilin A)